MNIEVYTIQGFTGSALKSKLEIALNKQNLPYKVKEINSVDDFIRQALTSVPAIKIGDKVIEYNESTSMDETIQTALDLIIAGCEKLILVPVDFTPESIHALQFARMMASRLGMGIAVTHIHEPLFDSVSGSAYEAEMISQAEQRLDDMVIGIGWDQYQTDNHVPVKSHFETGDVEAQLRRLAENDNYELIVMSTNGESSFMKRIFGSVSSHLSRSGSKPVIVVPPNAPLKFPAKMVVGLTNEMINNAQMDYMLDFASDHYIFLDFVYATNDPSQFNTIKEKLNEKLVHYKNELCGFNISMVPFRKNHIHESLEEYATKERAGMIVLIGGQKGFLQKIMHLSVTEKALLQPSLPVMILHDGTAEI